MRILLSNDDSYFAPGLAALSEGLKPLGRSPSWRPSATERRIQLLTLDRPLMLSHAHNGFHYVNGTPTDCVHMAVTGLLDFEPDVIVSGINSVEHGDDTLYPAPSPRPPRAICWAFPPSPCRSWARSSSITARPPAWPTISWSGLAARHSARRCCST
jgi:hypothetical protein